MKNKFITFGIILICFATIAMGVQTFASGTGMSLKALKGPIVTDLYIIYEDSTLNNADRVKITAYYINSSKKFTEVYSNIAIVNGISTIPLTNLDQNETIFVEVTIGTGKSRIDMSGQAMVKLRPDLTIQSINPPVSALNTSYFNVDVNVTELNRDIGANFTILIKEGELILASELSQVASGGSVSLSIPLLINQVGFHNLSAVIVNSDPAEYSTSNNQQDFAVEIIRPLQKPDLTIQNLNAPSTALNTSYFNVDVNVSEVNGETGANFTILIKEGELILASELSQVASGGSVSLSIPVLIDQVGFHNLSAVIVNSDPAEYSTSNNRQDFAVEIIRPLQKPDLTIQSLSVPATALNTSYFNVDVNVSEVNGETGANFTLIIKEGEISLASEVSQVASGGSVSLSIPIIIDQVGFHNLSAMIVNSDPAEDSIYNNQQNFTIDINQLLLNPADYSTWYYSQKDYYNNNKNLNSAADGGTHIEVSNYMENKISERFFYNLTINKELIFPIDSVFIKLYNESGVVEERENTNIIPTKIENGNTIASVYYPETGSTITIISKSSSTEIKLEKRVRYQQMLSSGYNYYSQSANTTWNSNLINQTGTLMDARVRTGVYIEVIDGGIGYGGTETMNLTLPVYSNSTWADGGVSGYRNIATYYTKQAGRTSI